MTLTVAGQGQSRSRARADNAASPRARPQGRWPLSLTAPTSPFAIPRCRSDDYSGDDSVVLVEPCGLVATATAVPRRLE